MSKRLVIIGAGGHGKVAAECAESMGTYSDIIFLDARVEQCPSIGPWKVVDFPEHFTNYGKPETEFFVAIGDNSIRQQWLQKLLVAGLCIATLIHASATVSEYSEVGIGSLLCAHAVLNPFAIMGIGNILNTGATVDHDCVLADYVHIAPGCKIAGIVKIGELSFIGIGSTVVQSINIGNNCVLGAGSVVVSDIKENSLGYGVPARIVKTIKK